jgi:hypothetical protein
MDAFQPIGCKFPLAGIHSHTQKAIIRNLERIRYSPALPPSKEFCCCRREMPGRKHCVCAIPAKQQWGFCSSNGSHTHRGLNGSKNEKVYDERRQHIFCEGDHGGARTPFIPLCSSNTGTAVSNQMESRAFLPSFRPSGSARQTHRARNRRRNAQRRGRCILSGLGVQMCLR